MRDHDFGLRNSRPAAARQQAPSADGDGNAVKRYSYAGPPKISLSTWNERPKRQVSIKTDRDYVIGIRQRLQQKSADAQQVVVETKPPPPPAPPGENTNGPVSRVPIVKSVELKKPYAEQLLQTTSNNGPVLALSEAIKAQAKLSNGYGGYRGGGTTVLSCNDDNVDGGGDTVRRSENKTSRPPAATTATAAAADHVDRRPYTFGKLMTRARKPREISANVMDPRENLLESIRSFGGRDNLRKIRT